MTEIPHLTGGAVRASEDERTGVVAELRTHCAEGRLSMDEFERRVALAMSAQTIHDLAVLVHDLPRTPPAASEPLAQPHVGPPGVRPFTFRGVLPVSAARVRVLILDKLAPALHAMNYELVRQSQERLEFRRGGGCWISFDLEPGTTGSTTMIIRGRAPRGVRKKLAQLSLS